MVKSGVIALYGKPISELQSVTCRVGSHDTNRHRWMRPTLPQPDKTGMRFTYPRGMEGWADLGSWLHTEVVYLPVGSHPSEY